MRAFASDNGVSIEEESEDAKHHHRVTIFDKAGLSNLEQSLG